MLLYATGGDHPLREPCREILTGIATGLVAGHITDVVVAEFLHIRASRTGRPAASRLTRDVVDAVTGVLPVGDRARARSLTIYGATTRLSTNDALIAGVALEHGLDLVTADRDFEEVASLTVIAPDAPRAPWRPSAD